MYDYLTAEIARFRADELRRVTERSRTGSRTRSSRPRARWLRRIR